MVRLIAGDNTIDEGIHSRRSGLAEIVDIDGSRSFLDHRLDAYVRSTEIGGNGRVDEGMRTSGTIDTIRGAVADLRVAHLRVCIEQHQTIERVIMDAAAVHAQLRHRAGTSTQTIKTDITGEYIHIIELIRLRLFRLQVDAVPTASGIEVRHVLEEPVEPVATDENGLGQGALRIDITERNDTRALVHIDGGSCLKGENTADYQSVINEVGFVAFESHNTLLRPSAAFRTDTDDVLSVRFHFEALRVAVRQVKIEPVGDKDGGIAVVRAYIHADENEQAVTTVDLQIGEPCQIRFAVHVSHERTAVGEPDTVDDKGILVAVIDHDLRRGAALLREDGVEPQRIAREGQSQRRIVTHLVLLASRQP